VDDEISFPTTAKQAAEKLAYSEDMGQGTTLVVPLMSFRFVDPSRL
jgi:hypothetical protein